MAETRIDAIYLRGGGGKPRPEEFHQVKAGTDKCPFTLCGAQSPAYEAHESEEPLDLTKYRLDGSASKLAGLATFLVFRWL